MRFDVQAGKTLKVRAKVAGLVVLREKPGAEKKMKNDQKAKRFGAKPFQRF